MRTGAAALFALLTQAALAADLRYTVGVQSEVRARSVLPGDVATTLATVDIEAQASGEAQLAFGPTQLGIAYTPLLVLREPQVRARLLPLHRALASVSTNWRTGTISLTQTGTYGFTDIGPLRSLGNLGGPPPVGAPAVQTAGFIELVSSFTSVTFTQQFSRTVSLSAEADYSLNGAVDGLSLPLQFGPSLSAGLRNTVTRVDVLQTSFQYRFAEFYSADQPTRVGQQLTVAQLTQDWLRSLTRTLSFELGAGLALSGEYRPIDPTTGATAGRQYFDLLPAAHASLSWRPERGTELALGVRLSPFADRFTALVYERLEGTASFQWQPQRLVTLRFSASAAYNVDLGSAERAGDSLYSADLSLLWQAWPALAFTAGARGLFARQPSVMVPDQGQWQINAGVIARMQDALGW
jgi:hypothetical protein